MLENADLNKNSALQNLNDSKAILANLPKQISENKKLIDHKKKQIFGSCSKKSGFSCTAS